MKCAHIFSVENITDKYQWQKVQKSLCAIYPSDQLIKMELVLKLPCVFVNGIFMTSVITIYQTYIMYHSCNYNQGQTRHFTFIM